MQPTASHASPSEKLSLPDVLVAILLGAAILFGGGGAEGPINNGAIEAASAVLLLILAAGHFTGTRPLAGGAWLPVLLLAGLLLLVAVQLVPLPPSTWHRLPERELMRSSLALIGQENSWRPLSLDPEATRLFGASLLTPAALMIGVLGATRRKAKLLTAVVVLTAAISGLIGAFQVALDYPGWLTFYDGPNPGSASGVFANSNHQASLLLLALVCLGVWLRGRTSPERRRPKGAFHLAIKPAWLGVPFLAALVVATGSRAGIGLLALAGPMTFGIALGSRLLTLASLGITALLLAALIMLSVSTEGTELTAAFLGQDPRFTYLPDVLFGVQQYWPIGAGAGTFPTVFPTYENLDVMRPETLNHAHNEYLEWLTDFGAAGALWLLVGSAALVWRLIAVVRSRSSDRSREAFALSALCLLFLLGSHSAVDYPIRTDAIIAIVGLAVGLLFAAMPEHRTSSRPSRLLLNSTLAGTLLVGTLIGAQVLRMRLAEAAVRERRPALVLRTQNGSALALAAEAQLLGRQHGQARALAMQAIDRTPLLQAAVSSLAAAETLGKRNGTAAWQVAAAMGWRDRATQLWAMHQAFAGREFATAAARADALLRSDQREEYLRIVRASGTTPEFQDALLPRLTLRPGWRSNLLTLPTKPSAYELEGVVATLMALGRAKELRRSDARSAIETLLQGGRHETAYRLYAAVQPPPRGLGSLNPDPGFDRAPAEYVQDGVAFDWQLSPAAGSAVQVDPATKTLVVDSDGNSARRVAYRYVPVKAGPYRLRYRVRGRPEGIGVHVACATGAPMLGEAAPHEPVLSVFQRREFSFDVPPSCPVIVIEFATAATGESTYAEFDDVMLSAS